MHERLVNRLGDLSLPRKSVVRLTDRPDMILDVYRGRKTTIQSNQSHHAVVADLPVILTSTNTRVVKCFSYVDYGHSCMMAIYGVSTKFIIPQLVL